MIEPFRRLDLLCLQLQVPPDIVTDQVNHFVRLRLVDLLRLLAAAAHPHRLQLILLFYLALAYVHKLLLCVEVVAVLAPDQQHQILVINRAYRR